LASIGPALISAGNDAGPGESFLLQGASIGPALISAGNATAAASSPAVMLGFNWAGADQRRK